MAQVLLEESDGPDWHRRQLMCSVAPGPRALGIPPERSESVPALLMVGLFTFPSFLHFLPRIYAQIQP